MPASCTPADRQTEKAWQLQKARHFACDVPRRVSKGKRKVAESFERSAEVLSPLLQSP